jgi:Zn-dependent peptidase ImmA (M78 family)
LSHETPDFIYRGLGLSITPAPAQELFAHIGAIKEGLSAITGLAFTRDVPYASITKDQLRKYLEQRLRDTMKPDDVRAEELTLKMLGLVPKDFDLRKNTLELLTEQAAAFYDYNQKRLFVLKGAGDGEEERVALIHELAHALADQHFHLAKFIHEGMKSDDDATARQAVMEGQATWLMTAYLAREAAARRRFPKP